MCSMSIQKVVVGRQDRQSENDQGAAANQERADAAACNRAEELQLVEGRCVHRSRRLYVPDEPPGFTGACAQRRGLRAAGTASSVPRSSSPAG